MIELKDASGCRVRWKNKRLRRYSRGGQSRERMDKGDGRISADGTHIQQALKVNLQNLMKDLISSSLTIGEQDPTGTSYIIVAINSGDLIHDQDELVDPEPTKINELTACLAYASIFIPTMVVKSYRIFSVRNLLSLSECTKHHCGMIGQDKWKTVSYEIDCVERRNSVFRSEAMPSEEMVDGMVDSTV